MSFDETAPHDVSRALARATERLRHGGVPDPRAEAEWLLARLLNTDRGGLLVRRGERLPQRTAMTFHDWVARRARREPAQHIVGTQEFHGLEFLVDRRVLIPRPETEGLVDAALELDLPRGASAADLGTGSGCLAVTLATRRPDLRVFALDRSADALDVARQNALRHAVASRVTLARADFASAPADWHGAMSLVVSNPPYVAEAEWRELEPEVRDHDPREALVAGPSGLECYPEVLSLADALACAGGYLLLEVGCGQADAVVALVLARDWEVREVRPDVQGIPRVVVARRSGGGS